MPLLTSRLIDRLTRPATPGHWAVDPEAPGDILSSDQTYWIARTYEEDYDLCPAELRRARADARLIAALPELLAATRDQLAAIEWIRRILHVPDINHELHRERLRSLHEGWPELAQALEELTDLEHRLNSEPRSEQGVTPPEAPADRPLEPIVCPLTHA